MRRPFSSGYSKTPADSGATRTLPTSRPAVRQGLEPPLVGGQEFLDDLELLLQDGQFARDGGVQFDGGDHRAARGGDRDVQRGARRTHRG